MQPYQAAEVMEYIVTAVEMVMFLRNVLMMQ
jgi:hypothetical protein